MSRIKVPPDRLPHTDSLRERKKRQTRHDIASVGTQLFAERGFDQVTVVEIAAAANVSPKTVFNYFPTKEDIVLGRRRDLDADLLEAIQERPVGDSVLDAVRRHTLSVATRLQAVPLEKRRAFQQVLRQTSSVQARWREMLIKQEAELAALLATETEANPTDLTPVVAARLLTGLTQLPYGGLPSGATSLEVVQTEIRQAFSLLEGGLWDYGRREDS